MKDDNVLNGKMSPVKEYVWFPNKFDPDRVLIRVQQRPNRYGLWEPIVTIKR